MKNDFEKLAEIRNTKGEALWSLWVNYPQARELRESLNELEDQDLPREDGKGAESVPGPNNDPMTDAQKRYLFRLLADKGIEGDAAYEHLKKAFGVDSLKNVTKKEASRAIDRMLNG